MDVKLAHFIHSFIVRCAIIPTLMDQMLDKLQFITLSRTGTAGLP